MSSSVAVQWVVLATLHYPSKTSFCLVLANFFQQTINLYLEKKMNPRHFDQYHLQIVLIVIMPQGLDGSTVEANWLDDSKAVL